MGTALNIQAWSTTPGNNGNSDSSINFAEGMLSSAVNDSARAMMAAIKNYSLDNGGALAAGGSANALTVSTNEGLSAGQLTNGLSLIVQAASTNTSTSVTFAPDGLTAQAIKRADGSALALGSIRANQFLFLAYNSGTSEWWALNIPPMSSVAAGGLTRGQLWGCQLSNSGGGTTAIDIGGGAARDSTDTDTLFMSTALTGKVIANAWSVGNGGGFLDTGAVANATYHVYLIKRIDTGVVDAIASLSASAPTLPANYTLYRRIGSIMRLSGRIEPFAQRGDEFWWTNVTHLDVASTNPGTSAVAATLTTPAGVEMMAKVFVDITNATSAAIYALVRSGIDTDRAPSSGDANVIAGLATGVKGTGHLSVKTDTNSTIQYRLSASGASDSINIWTLGWTDFRGRLY